MIPRRILSAVIVAASVLAACSVAGGSPVAIPAPTGRTGPSAGAGSTVGSASSSSFGTILIGANGMTLYTSAGDPAGSSTCTGACATAWPPLTIAAGQQPTAGAGVTGVLSTLNRPDGTTQVAYDGLPLYYWQADKQPGDITGDGVNGFSVAKGAGGGGAPASSAPSSAPSSSGGKYGY